MICKLGIDVNKEATSGKLRGSALLVDSRPLNLGGLGLDLDRPMLMIDFLSFLHTSLSVFSLVAPLELLHIGASSHDPCPQMSWSRAGHVFWLHCIMALMQPFQYS